MNIQVPKVIRKYNIYFGDDGWAGICSEVQLPNLEITRQQFRGGGMDGNIPIGMGIEDMELTCQMEEHNERLIRNFGNADVSGRFSAALTNGKQQVDSYKIEFRGLVYGNDLGTVAPGEKSPMKVSIQLSMIKITLNGSQVAHIDLTDGTFFVGGNNISAHAIEAAIS